MRLVKYLLAATMVTIFFSGLGIFLYPIIRGAVVDASIQHRAEEFLSWVEVAPYIPPQDLENEVMYIPTEPTEPENYPELWHEIRSYNEQLYLDNQKDFTGRAAYENISFVLADYGLPNEVFGVLTIPSLELDMPLYLGASSKNMALGAAILTETSIPVGGLNTNAVIAGHRGWNGAAYFLHLDQVKLGDEVVITNLWEELHYRVVDIQIVAPNAVESVKIQPGRELITLLTCHPPATGGRQRYLVFCERIDHEQVSNGNDR